MRPHAEDLQRYYASPVGQKVQARISKLLMPLVAQRTQDRVLGLGYCGPYLQSLHGKVGSMLLAHPALQGYAPWPEGKPNCVVQVDDKSLPFRDAMFDQVVAIHALEYAEPVRKTLREIWRVLSPQGRLLLVVPNRTSLMALLDNSPFGNGRPFSTAQLRQLLTDSLYTPLVQKECLALPGLIGGAGMDRFLLKLIPRISGVHILLAQKTDGYSPTGVGRVADPAIALVPSKATRESIEPVRR
jgi:SAM-dependent methyltransferase